MLCLFVIGELVAVSTSCTVVNAPTPPTPPAAQGFYLSPTGNDGNPGTQDAPFLTPGAARSAMRAAPAENKNAYFLPGTYTVTVPIGLTAADNGETWTSAPGNPVGSATLVNGSGVTDATFSLHDSAASIQNLTFSNLTFDGGVNGSNAVFLHSYSNNIHVTGNQFKNHINGDDLHVYNSDRIYFTNNKSGPNEHNPVGFTIDNGKVYTTFVVAGNTFSGFNRIGIEIQSQSGYLQDIHVDWNTITITDTSGANGANNIAISFVPHGVSSGACNTVWGNNVTGVSGGRQWFLELHAFNTSVEANTETNLTYPIVIADAVGSKIENNTFVGVNPPPPYSPNGAAYTNTQWVGVNTINGASVTGWTGVPNTGSKPASCTPTPHS